MDSQRASWPTVTSAGHASGGEVGEGQIWCSTLSEMCFYAAQILKFEKTDHNKVDIGMLTSK